MYSLKLGRGPSFMGAVGGIFAALFGCIWTILAFNITRGFPFPLVGVVFPLFGLVFVTMGIGTAIYNFLNVKNKNRFSLLDITPSREEPDPLNQLFGDSFDNKSESIESRLASLKVLKSNQLISEDEYKKQRDRILNSL